MVSECQGLRSCVLHHPPAATFFVCLLILATALLSLGAYLNTYPVSDADYTQDWDGVLRVLSTQKICPAGDAIGGPSGAKQTQTLNAEDRANVSIQATVRVSPWPANHSSLHITTTGTQLGIKGLDADSPMTVSVTPGWSSIQCNGNNADCFLKSCIHISGPSHLLPQSRSPTLCPGSNSSRPVQADLYVLEPEPSNSSSCYSFAYLAEPHLKNVLSEEDVTLCVQRLTYTALAILLLALLYVVAFACCNSPVKEIRAHGPL